MQYNSSSRALEAASQAISKNKVQHKFAVIYGFPDLSTLNNLELDQQLEYLNHYPMFVQKKAVASQRSYYSKELQRLQQEVLTLVERKVGAGDLGCSKRDLINIDFDIRDAQVEVYLYGEKLELVSELENKMLLASA